ncbi:MAG: carboxypeptidase-like regulatory domain-containing protein [archaeon]
MADAGRKMMFERISFTLIFASLVILLGLAVVLIPGVEFAGPSGMAAPPGPVTLPVWRLESCNFTSDCGSGACRYDLQGYQYCVNDSYTCPVHSSANILVNRAYGLFTRDYADAKTGTYWCNDGWWSQDPFADSNNTFYEIDFTAAGTDASTYLKVRSLASVVSAKLSLYGFSVGIGGEGQLEEMNRTANDVWKVGTDGQRSKLLNVGGNTKIFVTGYGNNLINSTSSLDAIVGVLNYTGGNTYIENFTVQGSPDVDDYGNAVDAIEVGGIVRVFAAGQITHTETGDDITVIALNYTGGRLYVENYTFEDYNYSTDYAKDVSAVIVDGSLKVFVSGSADNADTGADVFLAVYNYTDGMLYRENITFRDLCDGGGSNDYPASHATYVGETGTKVFVVSQSDCTADDTYLSVYNYTDCHLYEESVDYYDLDVQDIPYSITQRESGGVVKLFVAGTLSDGTKPGTNSFLAAFNYSGGAVTLENYTIVDLTAASYDNLFSVDTYVLNGNTKLFAAGYGGELGGNVMHAAVLNYTNGGFFLENRTYPAFANESIGISAVSSFEDGNIKAFIVAGETDGLYYKLRLLSYNYTGMPDSYPRNIGIDVGNDGSIDVNYTGELNYTILPPAVDFTSALTQIASNCTDSDSDGYCDAVYINVSSGSAGRLVLSLLDISYNLSPCSDDSDCERYCVHSVCRATSTYSGDGYCDSGETYLDDSACAAPTEFITPQIITKKVVAPAVEQPEETVDSGGPPMTTSSAPSVEINAAGINIRYATATGSGRPPIVITVTDRFGSPVENIEVALITSTGAVIRATTNQRGEATIYEYPGDPLAVKVEADGVEIATRRMEIDPEAAAQQELAAAEMGAKMSSWAVILAAVLVIPLVGFYIFSRQR